MVENVEFTEGKMEGAVDWFKSTHNAYEDAWKCGELKLCFATSAGWWKTQVDWALENPSVFTPTVDDELTTW